MAAMEGDSRSTAATAVPSKIGKYTIVKHLGAGGMADVYLCRHAGLGGFDKQLVVKTILPQYANEEEFVRMFLDEARIAAHLNHTNIVHIFDIDVDPASQLPFIAMEYVPGPTLAMVSRAARQQGKVDLTLLARIGADIALGLSYAHSARDPRGEPLGLVHRDVSPGNIVVSTEGVAKLLDFGVAMARNRLSTTRVGTLKGKLRYMAPEQARGEAIDRRVDVYALGMCLFQAMTGQLPFGEADNEAALLNLILEGRRRRASEIVPDFPRELEHILEWAADPDVSKRCQDARMLYDALEAYLRAHARNINTQSVAAWLHQLFPEEKSEAWTGKAYASSTPPSRSSGQISPKAMLTRIGERAAALDVDEDLDIEIIDEGPSKPRRARRKVPLAGLLAGVALVSGLGAAAIFLRRAPEPAQAPVATAVEPPAAPHAAPADPAPDKSLKLYLEEVERLLALNKLSPAEELLRKASALTSTDAELNIRLARDNEDLRNRMGLARAEGLLQAGDYRQSIEALTQILTRDPKNAPAQALLRKATDKLKQAAPPAAQHATSNRRRAVRNGRLTILSEPAAVVFVDDDYLGQTPIKGRTIGEGQHSVRIRAEGYAPFEKQVVVSAGREARLVTALKPVGSASEPVAEPARSEPAEPAPTPAVSEPPVSRRDPPAPTASAPTAVAPSEPVATPPPVTAPTPAPAKPPEVAAAAPAVQASPPPAPAAPATASLSRLPVTYRARNSNDVFRVCQVVEQEAVKSGGVSPALVKNVTGALAQELTGTVMVGQGIELYPRGMLALIVKQARAGASRSDIAEALRRSHVDGKLSSETPP